MLMNGASHRPMDMDDALGLGVLPEQIALVLGQFVHSKNTPALGRVKSDGGSCFAERLRDLAAADPGGLEIVARRVLLIA
jgi:hypothetical protein